MPLFNGQFILDTDPKAEISTISEFDWTARRSLEREPAHFVDLLAQVIHRPE